MLALLVFGTGAFMSSAKFKYGRPGQPRDKNHSSFVNTPPNVNKKYIRQINPNEYGNLVAYSPPINHRVKPNVNRNRSPNMVIDEGISPFRNTFDYVVWACIVITLFIRPPPPPSPPMTPILVEEPIRAGTFATVCACFALLLV
tara:strand:- start:3516 stop:3947 length:432 start_codon:yes stop_codon:yes gene_type:complete